MPTNRLIRSYDSALNFLALIELAGGLIILGVVFAVINWIDLSDANKICAMIASSTVYLGLVISHGLQSGNAQVHQSTELIIQKIENIPNQTPTLGQR